jgi:hypothetical protein
MGEKIVCVECEEPFVIDDDVDDTVVCLDCRAFSWQENRNENPDNWGFAYINERRY